MQCVRMGDNRGAVGWKEYDVQSIGYARTIIQHTYRGKGGF